MHLGVSPWEKAIRTAAVYLAILLMLHVAGKRSLLQLNSFDLVVLLLLSNVVQNAVIGPDDSLLGGVIGAGVLIAANSAIVRFMRGSERTAHLLEGTPTVLARDGHWDDEAMRREGLRRADVDAALRRQNANDVSEVERLSIEPGGAIIATLKPEEQSATAGDIARLEAKIDALLAARG